MTPSQRTLDQIALSREEYALLCERLDREPNEVELGMVGALWSEHCGYKNSRPLLRLFPTTGARVLTKVGEENAGVVDIGDGLCVAFKIESHNHPSAIEPYQGAATGVGGIVRDIFAMGARPIAILDSLRFGPLTADRNRYLFSGVVGGIGGYGNCLGVPTVGGEVAFDEPYSGNPLVNAMCVGLARIDKLARARADGPGNPLLLVGADTGRDGIHGATFASVELDESSEERRPAVQVGNPFLEKLLMEACVELAEQHGDWIVGLQDLGAAGLTSAAVECAAKAGTGLDIDVAQVPRREEGMTPYEVMLSESQERMLVIAKREHEADVRRLFERWELHCATIGVVTDDGMATIRDTSAALSAGTSAALSAGTSAALTAGSSAAPGAGSSAALTAGSSAALSAGTSAALNAGTSAAPGAGGGETVARVPVQLLTDPPQYTRESIKPRWLSDLQEYDLSRLPDVADAHAALLSLLASPEVASKRYVWRQYDHQVLTNTVAGPGSDAAVVRVKGTNRAIALTTDGDGRMCYLDPHAGGAIAVAEAARNIVCTGAEPLALTNCLNFGNPEKPEGYYQLEQAIRGMAAACESLGVPVVSGNVSLYNESNEDGRTVAVYPTPVVGMLGLIEDVEQVVPLGFQSEGDEVFLLGGALTGDAADLAGSEYLKLAHEGLIAGRPRIDIDLEVRVQRACLEAARSGLLCSAHDCSRGGLVVTLAECCMASGLGLDASGVTIDGRLDATLFGEAPSRIVVSTSDADKLATLVQEHDVPLVRLGTVAGERLRLGAQIDLAVAELNETYENGLPRALGVNGAG